MTQLEEVQGNMDKFEQVANLLGWQPKEKREAWHSHFVIFYGGEKRTFVVNFHLDHYTVSGSTLEEFDKLGCYLGRDEANPRSTESRISVGKPVERIAKEIARRVVQPYEPIYQTMLERIDGQKRYTETVLTHALRVAKILNAKVQGVVQDGAGWRQERNEDMRVWKSMPGQESLQIRFYKDGARWEHVTFPHDLHEKICQVIAAHYEEKEKAKADKEAARLAAMTPDEREKEEQGKREVDALIAQMKAREGKTA